VHDRARFLASFLELVEERLHLFVGRFPRIGQRHHFDGVRIGRRRREGLLRLVRCLVPSSERRKDITAGHLVAERFVPPEELHVLVADVPPDLLPVPGDGDPVVPPGDAVGDLGNV